MSLPPLKLRLVSSQNVRKSVTKRWLKAVGEIPDLPLWKSAGQRKHDWLHTLASKAEGYVSAYEELTMDELMQTRRYSVEHVVPRSRIDDISDAESDPNGWVEASRRANSTRSNLPLLLWPDKQIDSKFRDYFKVCEGVVHYVPPPDQRARLARKWLYMHATYPHDIYPPSVAQLMNLNDIIELARSSPISESEQSVSDALRDLLGFGNPLLTDEADSFYEDVDWVALLRS